ncbi:serine--tRNA ligase [Candidatus Wolfebacteria bacterium]|nr:MAG: serine--tRNA ligase [Candidatus Wolfebacteria bacterium]
MLDIKFIKENPDLIKDAARKKHIQFDVDELLKVEEQRVELLQVVESHRAKQNKITDQISQTTDQTEKQRLIEEMRTFKEDAKKNEETLKEVIKEWQLLMLHVPNIPDVSVPEGKTDEDNQEIRNWGEKPEFNFEPKDHIELMEKLDMADFERGSKVSGFRGYFLKNDGALLSFALWNFFLDNISRKGYTPLMAPSIVKKETLIGTGFIPQHEEDLYKIKEGHYLSGTGEVPTMGYFMDEVLKKEDLPQKFITFSPCFREEAGSHGRDVKGLVRVHEFFKLEQVIISEADHEQSVNLHEEITANVEELMKALNIPYRVVVNAGGDLGIGQVKKYDIEAWVPSQNKYRETHSASYFHDFQTRRLNIRYKDESGKMHYAHSLNNTAVATPRFLVALIENNQQEDGSIKIPVALQKYLGKDTIS